LITLWLAMAVAILLVCWWLFGERWRRSRRLARLATAADDEWTAARGRALARDALHRQLPPGLRSRHAALVRLFMAEVAYTGCNGLTVVDAMRLRIASRACVLRLGQWREGDAAFPGLQRVLLYPDVFRVPATDSEEGVVSEGEQVLAGQAFDAQRIVLSWADVCVAGPGYDVVVHEFAHWMDEAGAVDLSAGRAAFTAAYTALCAEVDAQREDEPFLDPYGAESEVEFFAVAAEAFITQPAGLRERHPALYAALRDAFALDPATWQAAAA
jgi:MtfA peptidase